MDSSQRPSPSIEATRPMAVVQRRSDQQQSLDVFDKFNVLPIEMRAMIWREALEEEAKTRFLLYDDSYFEERDGSMGNGAVFFPHKKLRSRLLEVNRESRWVGLKFYYLELKVYPRASEFMAKLLDDINSLDIAEMPRHSAGPPLGVVHIRPEQDTVFCHIPFNDFSFPQVGDVNCVTENLSAKARENFRQLWCINPGWYAHLLIPELDSSVVQRIFKSLCSDLNKTFPSNEGIVRFDRQSPDTTHLDREVLSEVIDRMLAGGSQHVRKHYAAYIRVYDKEGKEKRAEDERQQSLDENTDS
ncbi:hypothetical protein BJ166DRAFT_586144 [Pestalotiopsis sp. NC0098]|nr:hypothetical protein BJ166DRAFT_586144 [Pestalotiopsis sp. NC0098]